MDKEAQVRERVRELRVYYTNLVVYAGVSVGCVLVWLLNGAGVFWPIWPMMAFGIAAMLQGARLGQLKPLEDWFPFLSPEWEENQVKAMLKESRDGKKVKEKAIEHFDEDN
ncbi:MAG: hypothetical protein K0R76_90 [Alphaproteobacteria bacterium]|jgi:hypothetical protein|nr:hypothetical protein [Alphaproteobacteria bacterium]MDF3033136.1 hypothetical protein [Alphaproteobacteria bacterium]